MATEDNTSGSAQEPSVPAAPAPGEGEAEGQDPDQGQEQVHEQAQGQAKEKPQAAAGGILPTKAAEDDPRRWGDADDDHDAWLKEQKPPHWG